MAYSNPAVYERFMGRWSALLAAPFVRFAAVRDGQRILDVGCGTGSLSRAVLAASATSTVIGIDPVASYVAFAREAVPSPRARFETASAESAPFPDHAFDAALALLVLQDFADPDQAVREMARVTRRGGVVATCLWDFRGGMPMFSLLWQALEAVAPEAADRQRRQNPPPQHTTPDDLRVLWERAGLSQIETATLDVTLAFASFDDYWQPFLGGSTPTSVFAAAVDLQTDGALARLLRDLLIGLRPDGPFAIPARAWAVKGTVQSFVRQRRDSNP